MDDRSELSAGGVCRCRGATCQMDERAQFIARVSAGELIFVGAALIGEPIGIVETESGTCRRAMPSARDAARETTSQSPKKHDNIPL
jgi:hypothetical protein